MAYIDTIEDPKLPVIYNVTFNVGKGQRNFEEDVMLVQFFLQRIYRDPQLTKPKGEMKVDGICGPVTSNWILKFQLDVLNAGFAVQVDGIVSRAKNGKAFSSVTNNIYTIVHLNSSFKKREPVLYTSLATHPEVPPKLRAAFAQMNNFSSPVATPAMIDLG